MPISESIEKNALDLIEKAFALPLESQASFLVAETAHDAALRERVMSLWKMNKTSPH